MYVCSSSEGRGMLRICGGTKGRCLGGFGGEKGREELMYVYYNLKHTKKDEVDKKQQKDKEIHLCFR